MIVDKLPEINSFKQCMWLEKYISFKNQKGNLAKNGFEKGFYKLLNNSVCGKTMEKVRHRKKNRIY